RHTNHPRKDHDRGQRCIDPYGIQSLEGSVLIQLNEAPFLHKSSAGCRNRTCFVSLKRRCIATSANPAYLTFGRRGGSRTHMNLIRSQVPDPFSHTPLSTLVPPG